MGSQGVMQLISGLKDIVYLNYSTKYFYYLLPQEEAFRLFFHRLLESSNSLAARKLLIMFRLYFTEFCFMLLLFMLAMENCLFLSPVFTFLYPAVIAAFSLLSSRLNKPNSFNFSSEVMFSRPVTILVIFFWTQSNWFVPFVKHKAQNWS